MNEDKKVLMVLARPLYPANDGRKVRLLQVLKAFQNLGYSVDIFSILNDKDVNEDLIHEELKVKKSWTQTTNHGLGLAWMIIYSIVHFLPLQVGLYYNRKTQKELNKIISNNSYDVLYFDMLRTGYYLKSVAIRDRLNSIIDMDDLLSERYKKELDHNHFKKIKHLNSVVLKFLFSIFSKIVNSYEAKTMEILEKKIFNLNSKIVLVSKKEKDIIEDRIQELFITNLFHLPLTGNIDTKLKKNRKEKPDKIIGFIGNLSLKSNMDGLKYFIEDNYNIIKSYQYTLVIIGSISEGEKNELQQLTEEYNIAVIFKGFVEDLSKECSSWMFALAPNRTGTGINTKVFDYLALGLPVIGYEHAFRSFEHHIGKSLFLIEEGKFVDVLIDFSKYNADDFEVFSEQSKMIYESEFSPQILAKKLMRITDAIVS